MSTAVAELEAGLNGMLNLKPPGVSGSLRVYTHSKNLHSLQKARPTHKLGVLYVVDSVTRKWVDQAKQHGQPINSSAQDGTYAAGVHRVTELLPVLMNDIIQNAPGEQKKLVDIWEKGQTFHTAMIESFKQKLSAQSSSQSTRNIARQNITAPPTSASVLAAANPFNVPPTATQSHPPTQAQAPFPVAAPTPIQNQPFVAPVTASNPTPGFPGVASGVPPAAAIGGEYKIVPLALLVLPPHTTTSPSCTTSTWPTALWQFLGQESFRADESRDRSFNQVRSPPRYHDRSRSRSPARRWDQRGRDYGGLGRGSDYRQRSPPGRRGRSPSPPRPGAKWVEIDRTLPQGHIKVLSRTLFVGGMSEAELRSVFGRHGQVQTCIVNKDKRHAFVKMVNRRDAVHAKEAMENGSFRTRWGVGFGPRDCSDYQTGISVIPISKLTEADRKWMLSAEFGGSGGQPIETGWLWQTTAPKSSRGGDDDDFGRWRGKRDSQQDNGPANDQSQGQPAEFAQFPFGIGTVLTECPIFPPGFSFPPRINRTELARCAYITVCKERASNLEASRARRLDKD
ncbi:hypothetical protein F4808DRAFT_469026 [Astrocystis sublimbata]|nr:hypothetical protein F4808DRAFT_469026 [Astrocystis sublimbata]